MSESVEVVGLSRLRASLDRLADELPEIAPGEAAQIIGSGARSRAPKRTGRLAMSFSSDVKSGVVSVSFGVPYAGPINFGTGPRAGLRGPHNIRATRFLSNAVSELHDKWMDTYSDAAQDACDRVKGA